VFAISFLTAKQQLRTGLVLSDTLKIRLAILALSLLVVMLQYQLWMGDGGLLEVFQLQRAIEDQRRQNEELRERNLALDAEVRDLKTAMDAIEERARLELGMVRRGETFFRVVE
jgi:cell division protein FtsB